MPEIYQVNISMSEDDYRMLDRLMAEDFFDNRSAFIRKLIRQEWARRYSQPNALISVVDALAAGEAISSKEEDDEPTS